MKIKFKHIEPNMQYTNKGKKVKVGDEFDLPKDRAEYFIEQGNAEAVKESPKQSKSESKSASK